MVYDPTYLEKKIESLQEALNKCGATLIQRTQRLERLRESFIEIAGALTDEQKAELSLTTSALLQSISKAS